MKKAIIAGATGLVGAAVARHFSSLGIEALCLGRKSLSPEETSAHFGVGSSYLNLAKEGVGSLVERTELIAWSPGAECVFFNFAWRGRNSLTDGSFSEQLNNAIVAAEAVRSAKKLGCIKFVNAGTVEETFVEEFLEGVGDQRYQSAQTDYALAKMASRDMCKMVAYLEKIDYVHTRLSVPLALDLSQGTYVASTLKKIAEGKPYEPPTNKKLFDVIFLDDVVRAYHLIGLRGKNKADYFIGTSRPATLKEYFELADSLVKGSFSENTGPSGAAGTGPFNTEALFRDTGFVANIQFRDMITDLPRP